MLALVQRKRTYFIIQDMDFKRFYGGDFADRFRDVDKQVFEVVRITKVVANVVARFCRGNW